jgi:hypothetical protein
MNQDDGIDLKTSLRQNRHRSFLMRNRLYDAQRPGSAAASRSEAVGGHLLFAVIQEAVHHIDVNVSKPLMLERLWDSAND